MRLRDLTSFEVPKFSYKYLRDEMVDGIDCFVIESIPKYKHSGYTKQHVWIDKSRYIVVKMDFYDRKESLLKTQSFKDYKQYLDKYWRASEQIMTNHQNGKSTVLKWENYGVWYGVNKSAFRQKYFKAC